MEHKQYLSHARSEHPHIVVMPFPAQGHLSPLLHLSKSIAAAGFVVSVINFDSIHKAMSKNWVPTEGLDIRLFPLEFDWQIPRGFDAYCMSNLSGFFGDANELGPALERLISKLSEEISPVLAIISDYFLPWTQDVADACGIPRVVLWSGNASWTAIEYYFPEMNARGQAPPTEPSDEPIDWMPGLSPVKPSDLPIYMLLDEKRWIDISLERAAVIGRASWVLVNSFYELEPETLDTMKGYLGEKYIPVGPMLLQGTPGTNVVLRDEDTNCIKWLHTRQESSVLYISFGSIAVLTSEQFQQLAEALELSKLPFLWVIRPELVVGSGHETLYEGFCERTKQQGYITTWAPQLQVLEHSSVGGFLTHCGWNSMLESISNGVPLIGWPWAAEQHFNCKLMVEDWKIGATFRKGPTGLYERDEILRVITMVMKEPEGEQMKSKVEELKVHARKAVEEDGLSRRNWKVFLAELTGLSKNTN